MADRVDKSARRKSGSKKAAGRRARDKPAATGPSVGERLRAEREKRDMSLKDAARELHLDHWLLEALERDDYAALGAPVFAKGHLRKYAALLEIPGDEVMIAYYQSESVAEAPPIVSESLIRARRERPGRWLRAAGLTLLGLLAVAAAVWWFVGDEPDALRSVGADVRPMPDRTTAQTTESAIAVPASETDAATSPAGLSPDTAPESPAASEPERTVDDSGLSEQSETTTNQSAALEPQAPPTDDAALTNSAPTPVAPVEVAEPAPVAAGMIRVVLSFEDDSWVELNDAAGRRLLYGMGNAGTSRTLTGEPPIQVFLGRARGVALDVDGRPFEIPPAGLRGNTARFQIDPPR